jgi:citronellol/citronellal dehydrogenase
VIAAKSEAETARLPGTIYSVAREVEALGGRGAAAQASMSATSRTSRRWSPRRSQQFGRVDILVQQRRRAVVARRRRHADGRFDLMHEVNVRAAFAAAQAVIAPMRAAGGGHIVVCSPPVELSVLPARSAT